MQGYYFCGDGARRDKDGYIWITGRVDDVLNVSGHRVGTAEVENALTQHPLCAEAAVIGYARDVIICVARRNSGLKHDCVRTHGLQPSGSVSVGHVLLMFFVMLP